MEAKIKARSAAFGLASTGTPQVCIEFYVLTGKYKEQTLMYYGNLSPNARQNTLDQLALLGWSGNVRDVNSMLRNSVRGRIVETELASGKLVAKVDWLFPLDRELTTRPMSDTQLDELQDLLGAPRERTPGDDDIPFG